MTRPKYILKHVVLISIFILVVLKLTGAGLREQEKEEIKIIVFVIATRIVSQGSLQKKRVKLVTLSLKVGWVGTQKHISDRKEIVT